MGAEDLDALLLDMAGDYKVKQPGITLRERALRAALGFIQEDTPEIIANRERCEESLLEFIRQAWHVVEPGRPYVHGRHIEIIAEHLMAVKRLDIRNLIINMPPSHMKSLSVSVFWFCWVWTMDPSSRWLFSSYTDSLSTRDSQKCQDIIKSPWYQELWGQRFRIRAGQKAMSRFHNNKTGYRIATSVMGRGTGEKGDYIIVDDPHKAGEIYSDVYRDRVCRWWSETMSTRGNDPATERKVIVMQRLHERDLTGYIISKEMGYDHLCLPAEAESGRVFFDLKEAKAEGGKVRDAIIMTSLQRENESLRDKREDGELLWPERFGEAELDKLKKELLQFGVSGQLQQRPAPVEGDVFTTKTFKEYRLEFIEDELMYVLGVQSTDGPAQIYIDAKDVVFFQTIDTALTTNASSKYTAVLTCAVAVRRNRKGDAIARYLLVHDAWRQRLTVPEQMPAVEQLRFGRADFNVKTRKFMVEGERNPWPRVIMAQYVEPKASGIGIIQQARADGRPVKEIKMPPGGKVERSAPVATLYESGLVYHNAAMPELSDFQGELLDFPSGQYDDWVDCLSYAGILFDEDRILTAASEADLICYPTEEDIDRELEAKARDDDRIVTINGREVYIGDDDDNDPFGFR